MAHGGIEEWLERSILTCPTCGHQSDDRMPTNASQFFYECAGCGSNLKPRRGDCCVYCSYGDTPCPPTQLGHGLEG